MHAVLQDIRYAFRTLRRSAGMTLVIIASLAIGIGANTAIFSVVNALLLKPLPYPQSERLAVLWLRSPGINIPQDWPSPGQYIDVRNENKSFDEMSISQGRSGTLLGLDQPQRVEALLTQSSLFQLLGAKPLYGRLLLAEEDQPGRSPVVILSHGFWTRIVQGRSFTDIDLPQNAEPVVVIDEKFAKRFWPDGDAIGKHLWNDPSRKLRIVGVVGTVKQYGLDIDGRIVFYRPSPNAGYQVAKTSLNPATVAGAIVRTIHEIDPTVPVFDVRTMTDRMSGSLARQRFSTIMLGAFAVFALILAVVGIYGVMSFLVTQGAHDIGVRMALGAEQKGIVLMVMRQGLELAGAGIVIGLIGAVALTQVMASLLFGVSARDLVTFSTVPLILIASALLASYIPALRATRVDPVVALRDE